MKKLAGALILSTMTSLTANTTMAAAGHYLEVIANPAVTRLNWDTPALLTRSYFSSAIQQNFADAVRSVSKSTVGHIIIHFNCTDTHNKEHDFYTGMSGLEDSDNSLSELFVKKSGLKLIFVSADDGYIETDEEARDLIYHHYPRIDKLSNGETITKSPRFIRFNVSPTQCEQALKVDETYKAISYAQAQKNLSALPANKKLHFGFSIDAYQSYLEHQIDPLSPLGGVCSGFAVAILKAAGIYNDEFDPFWKRQIQASADLIGGKNPATGKAFQLPFTQLIQKKGSRWLTPGLPVTSLKVYEPELIWNFIEGVKVCTELSESQYSATPSLCTPDLKIWLDSNRNLFKTKQESPVTADFEKQVITWGPKGQPISHKNVEYEMTTQIQGIELIAPTATNEDANDK